MNFETNISKTKSIHFFDFGDFETVCEALYVEFFHEDGYYESAYISIADKVDFDKLKTAYQNEHSIQEDIVIETLKNIEEDLGEFDSLKLSYS